MKGRDAKAGEKALEEIRGVVREEIASALGKARKPKGAGRLLYGKVRYFRLPEVLQLVSLQRLSGRLTMVRGGEAVRIFMRGGKVAFATGEKRAPRELLGFILTSMGRLTKRQLSLALGISKKSGKRLGEVLLKEGIVSRDDIKGAMLKQTERSVCRAMAWDEGEFYFQLCAMPEFVEDTPADLKVSGLILDGVRQIGEARLLSRKIPNLDTVFTKPVYPDGEPDDKLLNENERLILGLIDGKSDVRELTEMSGLDELNLMRGLYALLSAGIIRKLEPEPAQGRKDYV